MGYFIHHGGSKSALTYVEEMAAEKNYAPKECLIDAHMYFHFKDGVWTDKRAKWVMEEVERKVAKLPQPVSNEEKNKIYLQVNGKNKKGQIVGQGNLSQYHASSSRSQHPFMTEPMDVSSNPTILKMQEEINRRRQSEEHLSSELAVLRQSEEKLSTELAEMRREVRGLAKYVKESRMRLNSESSTHESRHSDPTE